MQISTNNTFISHLEAKCGVLRLSLYNDSQILQKTLTRIMQLKYFIKKVKYAHCGAIKFKWRPQMIKE